MLVADIGVSAAAAIPYTARWRPPAITSVTAATSRSALQA
jgi:hypothetical protein